MSATYDMAIVGAGIVGAACAAEGARAGLKVRVLDGGPVGGGTTGVAMGHIVVMDDSEAQHALTAYSRRLWRQLASELPASVEYEPCGTLWVAADDEEMAAVYRKNAFYSAQGSRVEVLDAAALRQLEPQLRLGLVGGLLVVEDAVIYPPGAARYLIEQATARGAEVSLGAEVRALRANGEVELADHTRFHAGIIVNAAGCGSPELTPGLPIRKRKGHLVITDRYPGYLRHQIIELGYLKSAHSVAADSVAFNVQPRRTGHDRRVVAALALGAKQKDWGPIVDELEKCLFDAYGTMDPSVARSMERAYAFGLGQPPWL